MSCKQVSGLENSELARIRRYIGQIVVALFPHSSSDPSTCITRFGGQGCLTLFSYSSSTRPGWTLSLRLRTFLSYHRRSVARGAVGGDWFDEQGLATPHRRIEYQVMSITLFRCGWSSSGIKCVAGRPRW
jgi:hypothetical protein